MERNLASKLNISASILIALLLILIGVTFVSTRAIGELAKVIREDNTRSTIQVERPAKISGLRLSYDASKNNIEALLTGYPKSDFESLLPFTSAMSDLAARVGVSASTTITSDVPVVSPLGGAVIPFRVEMRTVYPTFETYVKELENLPYFIEIERYSITDSVNVNGVSDVRIEAKLYVRSEE